MRNNTTILFRAMTRLLIEFLEARLPMDVSWHCTALRPPRQDQERVAAIEDPPGPVEIEVTHAIATMGICGFCSSY
jgi:hypothetical protein